MRTLVVLLLTAVACSPQPEPEAPAVISAGTPFTIDERAVNVRVPADYEAGDARYNVVYLIDGGVEQDFLHIAGLAQLASINGDYEELIIVGIQTYDRFHELTHEPSDPRYAGSEPGRVGGSAEFRRYIVDRVVPWVEAKFRVGPRRTLMGESLAGLFVTESFLVEPDAFTDYVSVSPSLWWDDRNLVRGAAALLAEHDGRERHLYLTMADEGGTMQLGLDELIAAIEAAPPSGLTWRYVDRSASESHATIYHGAAHDAFDWLFDTPHTEPTETPWYLIEGGQPPDS